MKENKMTNKNENTCNNAATSYMLACSAIIIFLTIESFIKMFMSKYGHGTNDFLEIIYENSDKILSGGYGILGIFSIILLQTGINNNLLKKENKIKTYPPIEMIQTCFGSILALLNFY